MTIRAKTFLQRWLVNTLGVVAAAHVVAGIRYDGAAGLIVASLLLGVLNAFVRPLMILLSLPLLIFTLGLFVLVINALLLYFVGWLVAPFHVADFRAAFWGALIVSLISIVANWILGTKDARLQYRRRSKRVSHPRDGGGPIIDV
jgi:putative membrane protein